MKSTSDELLWAWFSWPPNTQYGISAEFNWAMTAANKSERMREGCENAATCVNSRDLSTGKSTARAGSLSLVWSTTRSVASK